MESHYQSSTGILDRDGQIRGVSLEISELFYPLPLIIVPDIVIPPLKEYTYDFENERSTLCKASKAYKLAQDNSKLSSSSKNNPSILPEQLPSETFLIPETHASSIVESLSSASLVLGSSSSIKTFQNLELSDASSSVLLLPTISVETNIDEEKNNINSSLKRLSKFDEFESKGSSVFDIVELHSIDDRKELELLLSSISTFNKESTSESEQNSFKI